MRMLDEEQMIRAQPLLALACDLVLNRQRIGITHAPQIANDALAAHTLGAMLQVLIARPYTLLNASPTAS